MPDQPPSDPPPWAAPAPAPVTQGQLVAGATQPFRTQLKPADEAEFQAWLQAARIPYADTPTADYDMRGLFAGIRSGDKDAKTAVNKKDGKIHFPDKWKTPFHDSFSDRSIYAQPDAGAPSWRGDLLVAPNGRVVADERAPPFLAPVAPPNLSTPAGAREAPAFAQQQAAAAGGGMVGYHVLAPPGGLPPGAPVPRTAITSDLGGGQVDAPNADEGGE